jgi:5'-3' exonuclease
MGIKHFFSWFRHMECLKNAISKSPPDNVDHVLIDMNGVIHEAAQFVFKYGKYQSKLKLPAYLKKRIAPPSTENLYARIKERVNTILATLDPKKSVFLAIDGVAPKSKQNQQRQRRFRAALDGNDADFDSNCITAGTDFMRELSANLAENTHAWMAKNVEVTISSDSSPGEGEHKLIDWINNASAVSDTYCIVGLDADLILLCMMANKENIYIMREGDDVDYINIDDVRKSMPLPSDDLIVLSCFIGNDFLPQIPSLEIKESSPETGALDYFIEYYVKHPDTSLVNRRYGFLNMDAITKLLEDVASREQSIMNAREDDTSRFENALWTGDIQKYRDDYHKVKLNGDDKTLMVRNYFKTVQWVYLYYSKHLTAMPSWDWYYPHNYILHAGDIVNTIPTNVLRFRFPHSTPSHPHEQLLRVIPPKNKHLIPEYLHSTFDFLSKTFNLFKIDKAGKREEWEALTIVDFVNPENVTYE